MLLKKSCFLLGFMGSGKTWWGQRLSEHLAVPFVDLDTTIEVVGGCSIETMFARDGAAKFRELERQCLQELSLLPPKIVATGGGTPCFFDNMAWMHAHGLTIYLQTPVAVLVERLRAAKTTRPLLHNIPDNDLEMHIMELLNQREPQYRRAQVVLPFEADNEVFLQKLVQQVVLANS